MDKKKNAELNGKSSMKIPGAGKFMSLVTIALFSSILVASLFISNTGLTGANNNAITGNLVVPTVPSVDYDSLKDKPPTYTNIRVTVYYTATYEDIKSWCSPAKGSCFENTQEIIDHYKSSGISSCINDKNSGYCCIPVADRGFYEEVKCEGSGVYNGRVYSYAAIGTQPGQGSPLDNAKYTNGRTAKDTNPTPKRTIAVNPKRGSKCYIPYMTNVYLYFGEGNPWNGVYVAEDTGSAFADECKIDLYTGVGKESAKKALDELGTEYPKVYILDDKGDYDYRFSVSDITSTGGEARSVPQTGIYSLPYTYSYLLDDYAKLYEESFKFSEEALSNCYALAFPEKDACVENAAKNREIDVSVNSCASTIMKIAEINAQHKYVDIEGEVVSKTPVQDINGEEQSSITIKDDTAELKVILKKNARTMSNLANPGQKVRITDAYLEKNERVITNPLKIKISPDESIKALGSFALSLADCTTSEQDECRCELAYAGSNQLVFTSGKITQGKWSDEDTVLTSENIYQQDLAATGGIIASGNKDFTHDFSTSYTKERIFFKKDKDKLVLYYDENLGKSLDACEPKHKHYFFCTSLKRDMMDITSQQDPDEDTFEPKPYILRFALKI